MKAIKLKLILPFLYWLELQVDDEKTGYRINNAILWAQEA